MRNPLAGWAYTEPDNWCLDEDCAALGAALAAKTDWSNLQDIFGDVHPGRCTFRGARGVFLPARPPKEGGMSHCDSVIQRILTD